MTPLTRRLACLLAFLFVTSSLPAAVWQWSVPVPSLEGRRAYLWVPPGCRRVRGLVIGLQNMLEQPLFERDAFRQAAAANDLGILLVFSGHDRGDDDKNPDHPKRSALDIFLNPNYPHGDEDPKGCGEDLQKALDTLATESGYPEIRFAPLMPVGHSSAGSFVWHLYRWDASRIFAMMPLKTGIKTDGPQGIPIFNVESEWFDYGGNSNNVSSKPSDIANQLRARANGDASLFGFMIDVGSGHCAVSDNSMILVSQWLKSAVAARIPRMAPLDAPVPLLAVKPESGWLIDVAAFGKPETKAVAYASYHGDPKKAFWYPDRALAEAVQAHASGQLAKKPQQLNFLKEGVAPEVGGTFSLSPKYGEDGATFRVEARFIEHLKSNTDLVPPDYTFEHGPGPILYKVNSGGLVQVGPDTFRACPRPGPIVPQGNPWEPTIVAYTPGDRVFRPTERPAHVNISIVNKDGAPQTLDFPKIADVHLRDLRTPVRLAAKASSGLPVEYVVVSGPAAVRGSELVFDAIPGRAKFPVRVLVQAFQWGRASGARVQSVGPEVREFFIQR